jgi:DNA (cytosine-5)-methyltransferase 1
VPPVPDEAGMNHVSLFTGIGGFDHGLRLAGIPIRTVLYCEYDKFCQGVIRQRVRDGVFDDAPIWADVRTLDGRGFADKVDILTAGFPCQPHSTAGQRRGSADDRDLWPDTARLIREIRPRYVILENVPGITQSTGGEPPYAATVLADLAGMGLDAVWGIVSAKDAGATHKRARWWVMAYAAGQGSTEQERQHQGVGRAEFPDDYGRGRELGDASSVRRLGYSAVGREAVGREGEGGFQESEGGGDSLAYADGHAGDVSEYMGNAGSARWAQAGSRNGLNAGPEPETGSGTLGHTNLGPWNGGQGEPGWRPEGRVAAGGSGEELGNAFQSRLEGWGQPIGECTDKRFAWPPSPKDADAWGDILSQWPHLAPAVESPVRGVADGIPDRSKRLAALGNGLVPAVCALFLRSIQ